MKVELSEERFRAVAESAITESIARSMSDWSVEKKMTEAIGAVVSESNWAAVVEEAIESIDTEDMAQDLARYFAIILRIGMKRMACETLAAVMTEQGLAFRAPYASREERKEYFNTQMALLKRAINHYEEEEDT